MNQASLLFSIHILMKPAGQAREPFTRLLALAVCVPLILQGCAFRVEPEEAATFRTSTPSLALPSPMPSPTPPPATATPRPTSTHAPVEATSTRSAATPSAPPPSTPTPTGTPDIPMPVAQSLAMQPGAQEDLHSPGNLTRFTIQVSVDTAGHTLQGRSRVVYTNTETVPLDSLFFRLLPNGGSSYGGGSLSVSRVLQDGLPVETSLSLSDSVMEARLANPLEPGQRAEIEMDFAGMVPHRSSEMGYGFYNQFEGSMALAGWYPMLAVYDESGWNLDPVSSIGDSVYADMAYYQVELTTQPDLVVAATGVEVDRRQVENGEQITFASGPVREFFMVLSDRLQVVSQTVQDTQVNSYYLPEHAGSGQDALEVAVNSMQAYNRLFGPYPYAELDIVDLYMNYAAGVEFPGIILIGTSLYEDPRQPFFTIVVSHEVAHQWWYNLVGNDVFDHPWLDEALATYSSALYDEQVKGPRAYQANIEAYQEVYDHLLAEGEDDLVSASLGYYEQKGGKGYGAVVYRKGALFFHLLRQEIGDEAFFAAMQAYFSTYRYQIARPDDLLGIFEAAAGRPLNEFFDAWLYTKK